MIPVPHLLHGILSANTLSYSCFFPVKRYLNPRTSGVSRLQQLGSWETGSLQLQPAPPFAPLILQTSAISHLVLHIISD